MSPELDFAEKYCLLSSDVPCLDVSKNIDFPEKVKSSQKNLISCPTFTLRNTRQPKNHLTPISGTNKKSTNRIVLAILFCDPMKLKDSAQTTVAKKRDYFASQLLRHCQLMKNEKSPARYIELLNIAEVLCLNIVDIYDYSTIMILNKTSRNEPLTYKNLHIGVIP